MDPRTPVLVGYGQINHREDRVAEENTLEPVDLMAAAARQAAEPRVLQAVDAISVVNLFSARYRDPGLLLGQRIGADHPATRYSGVGGNVAANGTFQVSAATPTTFPLAGSNGTLSGPYTTGTGTWTEIPAIGAIDRANDTHMGWSGSSEPASGAAVPPRRTASVRCENPVITCGEVMNSMAEPMNSHE